jgi:uncharacterized protein GlcG (DUF336 family)
MHGLRTISLIAGMMAIGSTANAQAPLTERNVSMGMAQAIIAGAIEQCTKDGYKVTVVIVDRAGVVMASLRGDGTNPHTMDFARMKAYTSRTRGITSAEFKAATMTPETEGARQIPGVVTTAGGIPIKIGTETIGGIGVSGAPGGDKDEVCAKAGLEKVASNLR